MGNPPVPNTGEDFRLFGNRARRNLGGAVQKPGGFRRPSKTLLSAARVMVRPSSNPGEILAFRIVWQKIWNGQVKTWETQLPPSEE